MRRKADMFKDFTNGDAISFLPGEGEQQATTNAAQMRERLTTVEEQLRSQFTSIAAYAQISQQAVETARAEARADLDREKATIVSLLERLRDEVLGSGTGSAAPDLPIKRVAASIDTSTRESNAYARLAVLEDQFENLNRQFALVLKGQEELANSIAFVFEQHMRTSGWTPGCSDHPT